MALSARESRHERMRCPFLVRRRLAPQPATAGSAAPVRLTKDTFACRFYQRIADFSPCEQTSAVFRFGFADRLCQQDRDA
jgi:hypothetical protein